MTTSLLAVPRAAPPRVHSAPAYGSSAGIEAIELAASAGLYLDPWQQQILVDALGERPDGRWAAFEVGIVVPRQNGKGAILEARELAGLFLFGDERLIMHTSHEFKTSLEAFLRVKSLIDNTDDLRRRVRQIRTSNGEEGIELLDGTRLRFLARSSGSGRGFSGDVIILDEAYALTDKQLEALMPTMSARPNPQIWYTSSPSLDAVSGAALMAVRNRGVRGEPGLAYFDYGCPRDADLDDRGEWRRANPAYGIRIFEEFVERERAAMSDEGFARERLGVWPIDASAQWQKIPETPWNDAKDATSSTREPLAAAIEMDLGRTQACIALSGRRETDTAKRHVWIRQAESTSSSWVVPEMVRLRKEHKICAVVVDSGGPAGSLIPDLVEAGFEVLKPTVRDLAGACGAMHDGIAGKVEAGQDPSTVRNIRHLGQKPLDDAIAGLTGRKVSETEVWERAGLGFLAVAAALALWGHAVKAPLSYDPLNSVFAGGDA